MTKRADTTAAVSAIENGCFMGRTLYLRGDARALAAETGQRAVPVFSATFADGQIVGSASAYAVIADTRHRVTRRNGWETALSIFGEQEPATRANGNAYLKPSPSERAMAQAMNRGGIFVSTPEGTVRLDCHGFVVV